VFFSKTQMLNFALIGYAQKHNNNNNSDNNNNISDNSSDYKLTRKRLCSDFIDIFRMSFSCL